MNEQGMVEKNREESKQRNETLKKKSADRLRKNAEWNKANKPKKSKE